VVPDVGLAVCVGEAVGDGLKCIFNACNKRDEYFYYWGEIKKAHEHPWAFF
jgi:hypothetical protein